MTLPAGHLRRVLVAVLLAVVALAVIAAGLALIEQARLRAWDSDCVSRGGRVRIGASRSHENPLIVQSSDTRQCVGKDGELLAERP